MVDFWVWNQHYLPCICSKLYKFQAQNWKLFELNQNSREVEDTAKSPPNSKTKGIGRGASSHAYTDCSEEKVA